MNLESITALFIAVGGMVTALATWAKHQGDKKTTSISEWKEIASNYKRDYLEIDKKIDELEGRIEERDYRHQLERNEWKKEREEMAQENMELNLRITILEEALIQEGVDVETL